MIRPLPVRRWDIAPLFATGEDGPFSWVERDMMSLRIGIDVGGTNTDAVLMDGLTVVGKIKTPTTEDVTSGITTALRHVLESSGTATGDVAGVMIGTTHFTNAVVERKRWNRPRPCASACRPRWRCRRWSTGRTIWRRCWAATPTSATAATSSTAARSRRSIRTRSAASRGRSPAKGITAVAVSSVFSPVNTEHGGEGRGDHARA